MKENKIKDMMIKRVEQVGSLAKGYMMYDINNTIRKGYVVWYSLKDILTFNDVDMINMSNVKLYSNGKGVNDSLLLCGEM